MWSFLVNVQVGLFMDSRRFDSVAGQQVLESKSIVDAPGPGVRLPTLSFVGAGLLHGYATASLCVCATSIE